MDENKHIGLLIRNADLTIANYVKKQLEPFNLAPEQNLIMMMLWEKDGISPNELSQHLKKDKANIARMIVSLEKKGYIKRMADPLDKRTFKVLLTEEGRQLECRVAPILEEASRTVMNGISPEQAVQLRKLLTKIIHNITGGQAT
ncbi:MarR family winged helix-turn-helix transcriptional regulator [Bacillus sp. FJAT-27245]|uniref:MarR family winged helix-turn-helix transcriptional regulator n=1 Tax=Bacillus sp. FJAT-27245 TaxID=1684144 RepID=UPI0006A7B544|nr:MarR family transcriptional regulator [Bacillus sp. FJAT-27245]